jgi:hypothetical protein
VQSALAGKMPASLVTPELLQDILKNVTLCLPDGYSLIAGANENQLNWYYESAPVSMLASQKGFLVVLSIPFMDVSQPYEFHKVYVLPTQVANNMFLHYDVKHKYFSINVLRRTHFAMSESDVLQCHGRSVKICPTT